MRTLVRMTSTSARRTALGTLTALLALSGACRSSSGPDWERVVGVVPGTGSSGAALDAPPTAYAGDVVTVTVHTVGSSTCTRAAGAEVLYRGTVAEITPYDWTPPAGTGCTGDRAGFPRPVELRFPSMGSYTIRVSGRAESGELAATIVEATIQITGRD